MRTAARRYQQQLSEGDCLIVHVHGKAIEYREVIRYWKRKGVSIDDLNGRKTKVATNRAEEYHSLTVYPVITPKRLAIFERAIRSTGHYYQGSFESGAWRIGGGHSLCCSVKDATGDMNDLDALHFRCLWASHLFSRGLHQQAGQVLITATARINQTLLAEDPDTLLCLFSILEHCRKEKRPEIAVAVIRQFSALGEVLLGSNHPLRCICDTLASVEPTQSGEIVLKCLQVAIDIFKNIAGPFHPTTLRYRRTYITTASEGDVDQVALKLQDLRSQCQQALGPDDYRSLTLKLDLAEFYSNKFEQLETSNISQDILDLSKEMQSRNKFRLFHANGLSAVALSQLACRRLAQAEPSLNWLIELRLSTFSPLWYHT